uniref:Uncharacterized protein n=1 Tax=Homo sapiens TaxID=9606 RepID=Q9Y476_HUMAN|nr:hypothetical protein [Homo sapiens]
MINLCICFLKGEDGEKNRKLLADIRGHKMSSSFVQMTFSC